MNSHLQRLMSLIREDAQKGKINNKKIAKELNVSEGTVSNYFNLTYRIPFNKLIELLNLIYDDNKHSEKVISEFLEKTDKLDNIKEAVEFFSINGDYRWVTKLIKKHKNEDSIFRVYELLLKRNRKKIEKKDFYRNVELCKENGLSSLEMKILCSIAHAYANLDFNAYNTLEFLVNDILSLTDKLNKEFLKFAYRLRCYELLAVANLMRCEYKAAEEILIKALSETNSNHFPISTSSFLNLLSELYVFTDFNKSLDYNLKAFDVFNKSKCNNTNRLSILEATHDFIKIHHNDYSNLFLSSPAEKAHFYAKIGGAENQTYALKILDEIEKNSTLSPFQLYYKGLALRDKTLLEKSEYEFLSKGSLHYAYLPRTAKELISSKK